MASKRDPFLSDQMNQSNTDEPRDLRSSPRTNPEVIRSDALTPPQTLSKKLFNLEHYISIPMFFMLSFFVYYDRGGLASALDTAQEQLLNDNAFHTGAVASCYLFGFCFTSPIFAILGNRYPPLKMSAIGMSVWCIGAFLTGWPSPSFISNFVWLAVSRLLTGIGEASFLAFVGVIVDIIAPDNSRSLWLASLFTGIPLGYAMGFAVGGTIADMSIYVTHNCDDAWYKDEHVTDCNESWRAIFISEVFFVLPLCLVLFCMKQPPNMLVIKQAKDELMQHVQKPHELHDIPVAQKLKRILLNRTFVFTCLGYAFQTFVAGTFAVDAITYLEKVYGWSPGKGGTVFGVITFATGVTGTAFGGWRLDQLKSKLPHDSPPYIYCKPALKFLIILSFLSFPCALIMILYHNIYVLIVCVALTEFLIFAALGPVNNVILWCVLYEDRPLAVSLNTLSIHALGDACAPLVVGALINASKNAGHDTSYAYNFAFGIAVFWLIFSGIAFTAGVYSMDWLERWMDENGENVDGKKTGLLINQT
eukprot:225643_1